MFDELALFGNVYGIEADPLAVSPNGRWSAKISQGPFDASYQTSQRFDLITMLDVLEHLPDAPAALQRVHTLLRPTGTLVLTVPAFQLLWTSHDDLNHHYVRYRKASLHPLLKQANLRIVESRYLFYWTCPVKLAIRIKERLIGRQAKLPQVPHRWINQSLRQLTRCEERLSRIVPIPFGSSLLVVAQPALPSDAQETRSPRHYSC